jgi:hypothetical protein
MQLFSLGLAAELYLGAAILAVYGMWFAPRRTRVWLLLPQQFLLLVSGFAALHAMILGQFADGVVRAHTFLIADQSPILLVAIFHTVALVRIARDDYGWRIR